MSDWTNPVNGLWSDATKWTGSVPDSPGAVANFKVGPTFGTPLIRLSQNETITIGTLDLEIALDSGLFILGATAAANATLRFQGAGGGPAFINVDSNGSTSVGISGTNSLEVALLSNLIVTTTNADTVFSISADIHGGGFDLYKFGDGTLRLFGDNAAMTGDFFINGGRLEINSADSMAGGGIVKLNGGGALVATDSLTLANKIETGTGNATGDIVAATGRTLTLSGELELRSSASSAVTFGSAADSGTIVLAGTSVINGLGSFDFDEGTVRLGNAVAAATFFAAVGGRVSVDPGAILDTGGFAATIANFDMNNGTLQATGGPLDVTGNITVAASMVHSGTVIGTGSADRLAFAVLNGLDLRQLAFNTWNASLDSITLNGSSNSNHLSGTTQNDTINGLGGNDTLIGNGGVDTIRGGTGNDTYRITDTVSTLIELAGEGTDKIVVDLGGPASFTLAANFENLTFEGSAAHTGTGNAAANVLTGGSGVDTLNGGAGADTMEGLGGDDSYFVDNALDAVVESAAGGTLDRVFASVSYTLGTGVFVERLTTTNNAGTGAINLTGNEFANTIYGNAGSNVLNGMGSADVLVGLGGNDFYYVNNSGDVVAETAGNGADRVFASTSYALAAGVHVELLTTNDNAAATPIRLTGNELANTIYGNAGANTLDGKGGNDTLVGLAGADTFAFTTAIGAGNVDIVSGFVVADDTINLENAVFTGLAAGALAAGAFNTGASASQADDRVIYNSATGALLFDADGLGGAAAVQFASLSAGLAMTASDFFVI